MKMIKQGLASLLLSLSMMCGCSFAQHKTSEPSQASRDIFAMDTYMYLSAYGERAETALDIASERILSLEETLSATNPASDTWAVNHADGSPAAVSEDTIALIHMAQKIGNATDGALDITLYPILLAWGFTGEEYRIPDHETLAALLESVDFRQISVDGSNVHIPADAMIDFGALAKGYTGDCILRILKENGIESGLVNLGGNVQVLGSKPDKTPWKIAVRHPFSADEDLCVLEVTDSAVITSGSYERYFTDEEGNKYWHILDPSDGYPADNGLVSVTVIGESGVVCDALSTALFVMGKDAATAFWQAEGGFDMILVTDSEEICYTQGLADSLQLVCGMKSEILYDE